MPQGLRDIRRRIRSVESTRKITQAMKMVAAAKLRRAQETAEASRPYAEHIEDALRSVAADASASRMPLLRPRPVQRIGYVVVTGDRGLSGPYNANILRKLQQEAGDGSGATFFAVGRKGRDYLRRRGREIAKEYVGIGDYPRYHQAQAIGEDIVAAFNSGEVDEVRLVYAQFVTAMTQNPTVQVLLPVKPPEGKAARQYIYEPDAETVLDTLVPHYLYALLYRALLEAKASEWGARMTAMDSASRNSEELIKSLVLRLNRLRQAAITNEIAEIVGGANALQ
jgi:F-type H+-transporting ATPase subunit gamma